MCLFNLTPSVEVCKFCSAFCSNRINENIVTTNNIGTDNSEVEIK